MRVMVIVKATKNSEAGVLPSQESLSEMGKFNEQLVKAGIMLSGDGLKPSSAGVRVRFSGQDRTVIDGPFAETKELVAGYWIWEVKSLDEAVEWVKSLPEPHAGRNLGDRNPAVLFAGRLWPGRRRDQEARRAAALAIGRPQINSRRRPRDKATTRQSV